MGINEMYSELCKIAENMGKDFIIDGIVNCFDSNIVAELLEHLKDEMEE